MSESTNTQSVSQERKIVTEVPGPKSVALHERRNKVVSTGIGTALPVYIEEAHGAILRDVDGNQFIDCGSGIGVTTIGHTDEKVLEAAIAQAQKLTHSLITVTPYESYVKVAEYLAKYTPVEGPVKSMLVNSGAEAVENAIKIARRYTGRPGVAVLECGYHGRTMLTATMNHKAVPYTAGFGSRASDIYRAPNSYPLHDGLTGEEAAKRTIKFLEKTVSAGDLACVIAEPVQGEGGFIVPADGYWETLGKWCRENGVLVIADEVQSGIVRTGTVYASEQLGIKPDMVTTAKGIAGGFPLSAVTGRAEIMDSCPPGTLGGTFAGNPIACAAAISVFEQIESDNLLDEAKRIEKVFGGGLRELKEKHPAIAEVRGLGAMLAIEITKPGSLEPDAELTKAVIGYAAQNGVLLLNAGLYDNVLRFLPSIKLTDELISEVLTVLDEAFNEAGA